MKLAIMAAIVALSLMGCERIETGNVGVRTTFTKEVDTEELGQGFYTALFSSIDEYSAREISIEILNMTPKAGDNLTMADLDVEIYYVAAPQSIADLKVKYANSDAWSNGVYYPAYNLVKSQGRSVIYDEIAKYDSLQVHKNREMIALSVLNELQARLEAEDPGAFTIEKVIIRNAQTDPSIEESIKQAVARNKELEAKIIEGKIADEQRKINQTLDKSLTAAVLEQRRLDVQELAIKSGAKVSIIMNGGGAVPIIEVGND